jgi:uncharacterized membrane protein
LKSIYVVIECNKGGEKLRNKIVSIILVISVLMSLCVVVNAAEDRSYYIDSYQISARVNENGDMLIDETLDYVFDGSFNGIYRTLGTEKNEEYENIQVFVVDNGKLTEFIYDNSERENTYQLLNEGNQLRIKAFHKSEDQKRTFVIRYKVNKAAIKYKDTAELYWQFTGKNSMDVPVNNYKVLIWLPGTVDKASIKAFAHGPLSGNVEISQGGVVSLKVDKLRPNNMVEARVLFSAEALNENARFVDAAAFDKIMAEEAQVVEAANRARMIARIFIGLAFVLVLIEILLILFIYYRYDKEFKPNFQGLYFRELPYDCTPAVMAVLWNFGKVTPKEITATLMDLVRRKVLQLKVEQSEKHSILGAKTEESYIFVKLEANTGDLKQHEQFLINWLINDIGDGTEINLDELKSYTKTVTNATSFKENYDAWVSLVNLDAEPYKFIDKSTVSGIALGIISGILGIGFGVFTLVAHGNIPGFVLLLITSISLIIYSALVKRRTKIGVEHFSKWKAFRKYLTDFSMLKEAEMPAIVIWEHFLVYAISLGVAKEVIKQLKVVFRDDDFRHSGLTYMYYGYLGHSLGQMDSLDRITTSITQTTESTYTHAMSQISSKGGTGGGFSGGGGGGGGGGGAGAF